MSAGGLTGVARGAASDQDDAHAWQPMRPYRGRRVFEIRDPILEPFWSGVRVIAHIRTRAGRAVRPAVELIEALGADVAGELPELRDALSVSVAAEDTVLDGVISRQVGIDGVGSAVVPEMRGRPALLLRSRVDLDVVPPAAGAAEAADGFIALDLLRLDGTTLLDVPLLERKRLLESVIEESALVRASVHVRPPIVTWIATWRSLGLRGGILKAANSRYLPGQDTAEWRVVERGAG